MNVALPKSGKYVVAVSGGVDSATLLHVLHGKPGLELVVAHFDHGIRADSGEDASHVKSLAARYGLSFVTAEGRLGARASEAAAREARYAFLHQARASHDARAVITAHHQDDVLETAVINLLRGTGRKGLSSLASDDKLVRPMLRISKPEILAYARQQGLAWREDSTNTDENYLRNYVRWRLLPRLGQTAREELLNLVMDSRERNREIDTLLVKYLPTSSDRKLKRQEFSQLPHDMSREVMATWLRSHGIRGFDSKTLERLVVAAKTAQSGSRFDVLRTIEMRVSDDGLALMRVER